MEKLFFNVSLPKAGSELLQVILHQNPRIYGSVTSPLIEFQVNARNAMVGAAVRSQKAEEMKQAFNAMLYPMAKAYYETLTDRIVVFDKNRGWHHNFEWVNDWNPNPRMICMVRDLRSIIASMEKTYRKNRHLPVGAGQPDVNSMTLTQRVDFWFKSNPVGTSVEMLQDSFERGVAQKMLFIRYEDFCFNPQFHMKRIYDFIGEPEFKHDFDNIRKKVYEDHSQHGPYGCHEVQPALRPCIPDSWKAYLPEDTANSIKSSFPWFYKQFGY